MPLLHHDRTVPTTRRSARSVHSDSHSHGHTRTHPRTAPSTVAPVQEATTAGNATKPSLLTRLAHDNVTTATSRPHPHHADSYGAETTAATMDGPTSHVPRYARGYAAPPPDPLRHHVPTVGDRMHGAAKKVAGALLLDRNKRAEGRAMEMGGAPMQPARETVVPSVVGGRRYAHSTRYHL